MWNKLSYDTQTTNIAVTAVLVVIGLVIFFAHVASEFSMNKMYDAYNNGMCRDCRGKYEYEQALDYGRYLYICNGCGNTVILNKIHR